MEYYDGKFLYKIKNSLSLFLFMNLDIHMIVILSELIYIGPHNVTMSYAKALKNYVEITNQVND